MTLLEKYVVVLSVLLFLCVLMLAIRGLLSESLPDQAGMTRLEVLLMLTSLVLLVSIIIIAVDDPMVTKI